ncbi:unnamed protein product [Chilo suppressalis]|uniref:Mos1 transposase HTH domain-containing protein n=1 Tax=Chilo suppressalis TaxID=168631 RepID=A0ABN8AX67_CHISP|nr:unnamed protein product [Chilo suppressalis]
MPREHLRELNFAELLEKAETFFPSTRKPILISLALSCTTSNVERTIEIRAIIDTFHCHSQQSLYKVEDTTPPMETLDRFTRIRTSFLAKRDQSNINAEWYSTKCLPVVFSAMNNKRPNTGLRGVLLHHDNAPAHSAIKTKDFLDSRADPALAPGGGSYSRGILNIEST